jgi:xanthine dehydrogenase accessory factor
MMPDGPLSIHDAARRLLSILDEGRDAAVMTVMDHPRPEVVGGRLIWDGQILLGSLQDKDQDAAAGSLARKGLSAGKGADAGIHTLIQDSAEPVKVFLELHRPSSEMVIVGAGHLAQPLCTLGALLGLQVTILDDRPEFATRERFPEATAVKKVDFSRPFVDTPLHRWSHVLLVTRGHRFDYECLRWVLQHDPAPGYVGMIGSRRRVRATYLALLDEGFSRDALGRVHAPIGLDVGAETPAEIAVAVGAEIVHAWYGGSCLPLSRVERVLDRLIPDSHGGGAEDAANGEEGS